MKDENLEKKKDDPKFTKQDKIVWRFIGALVVIVIIFVFLKYPSYFPTFISSLVAIGTLSLAYYAYKSLKEVRKLRAMEIHSRDLKKIVKQWKGSVWAIQYPENIPREKRDLPIAFEEKKLFKDLIENHTPYENLLDKWSEFKKKFEEYEQNRIDLYENIQKDVRKVRGTLPHHISLKAFFEVLYDDVISLAKSGKFSEKYSEATINEKEGIEGII